MAATRVDRPRSRRFVPLALASLGVVTLAGPAAASTDTPLGANGTLLQAPGAPGTVTVDPATGCRTLLPPGPGDCGVVHAAGGDLLYTVASGPPVQDGLVSRPWTVTVYRPSSSVPNGWQRMLVTSAPSADPAAVYANVTAKTADLTGDGHQSLLLGYRAEGTGQFLDLDIVVGTAHGPVVAAHRHLARGVVAIAPGRLVTYDPVYLAGDGNCCPTFTQRNEIRYRHDRFVLVAGPRLRTSRATIPSGDLG